MTKEEALKKIDELRMFVEECDKKAGFESDEIFLLSREEYEKYRDVIPYIPCTELWLRDSGAEKTRAVVAKRGVRTIYRNGNAVDSTSSIWPATHLGEKNIPIGTRVIKYSFPWIVIDEGLAIAETPITNGHFDDDRKTNKYKDSSVRQFLSDWLRGRSA